MDCYSDVPTDPKVHRVFPRVRHVRHFYNRNSTAPENSSNGSTVAEDSGYPQASCAAENSAEEVCSTESLTYNNTDIPKSARVPKRTIQTFSRRVDTSIGDYSETSSPGRSSGQTPVGRGGGRTSSSTHRGRQSSRRQRAPGHHEKLINGKADIVERNSVEAAEAVIQAGGEQQLASADVKSSIVGLDSTETVESGKGKNPPLTTSSRSSRVVRKELNAVHVSDGDASCSAQSGLRQYRQDRGYQRSDQVPCKASSSSILQDREDRGYQRSDQVPCKAASSTVRQPKSRYHGKVNRGNADSKQNAVEAAETVTQSETGQQSTLSVNVESSAVNQKDAENIERRKAKNRRRELHDVVPDSRKGVVESKRCSKNDDNTAAARNKSLKANTQQVRNDPVEAREECDTSASQMRQSPPVSSYVSSPSNTEQQECIVSILFENPVSKSEAVESIKALGFQLNENTVELDTIDASDLAYGVLVKCPKRHQAMKLVKAVTKDASGGSAITATICDEPLAVVSREDIRTKVTCDAQKLIETQQQQKLKIGALLETEYRDLEVAKRSKKLRFEEFERREAYVGSLREKLEELIMQQCEFETQTTVLVTELDRIMVTRNTKTELYGLLRKFELECKKFSAALPMYGHRTEIVETVRKHQVSIVLGETGSGKSTQILQYLHDGCFDEHSTIVCTQPRKVAAVSLATRVAEEMMCGVGELVGYKVGMKSEISASTKLVYVTDHSLLNECLIDRLFTKYSCIVVDEAHERSIYTDLLLGFIKKALPYRTDLRVIVMSATIDPKIFQEYFSSCASIGEIPVLRVSGRVFPVEVLYEATAVEDYVTEATMKALEIHRQEAPGDVLVFLTSPVETEQACKKLKNMTSDESILLLELHGRLQLEDQRKVFANAPVGKRKIVFATNSAETSITIPGIKYVIDSGRSRDMVYDPKRNMSKLVVQWVTQSSAEQRKGRAGRTDCGKCFRLYSQANYEQFKRNSVPEILRIHLGQAVLKLMLLGISDVRMFDFVQAPSEDALDSAIAVLSELGAIDCNGITETGQNLSKMSLEPRLGKVVLKGIEAGIPFESVVLAAVSTVGGSIFFRAGSEEEKQLADRKKIKFCDDWGDIITFVNVYRELDGIKPQLHNKWCKENSINAKSVRTARSIVDEIVKTLKSELGQTIQKNFTDDPDANEKMAKILFDCYSCNLSYFCGHRFEGYVLAASPDFAVQVHPSSCLNFLNDYPQWIVYEQVLTTSRTYLLNATYIKESWVTERIGDGRLCQLDLSQLTAYVVVPRPVLYVGTRCIRALLANKATVKRDLETRIRSYQPNAKVQIDVASLDFTSGGTLTVYSTPNVDTFAVESLNEFVSDVRRAAADETVEEPVLPFSLVRFVLERGAVVRTILMPDERRKVVVTSSSREDVDIDEAAVRTLLERFGDVETIQQNVPKSHENTEPRFFATFIRPEEAASAVLINDDERFSIKFAVNQSAAQTSQQTSNYTVKVTAQRRPLRDFCYVEFADDGDLMTALLAGVFRIRRDNYVGIVSVKADKKRGNQLYLQSIPYWADEDTIRTGLQDVVGRNVTIKNVNIPRAVVPTPAQSVYLLSQFSAFIRSNCGYPEADFDLNVRDPKEKDYDMIAYLAFKDPQKARAAADRLHMSKIQNFSIVTASMDFKVAFNVPKYIYNMCKRWLSDELQALNENASKPLKIDIREVRDRPFIAFTVVTTCLSDLVSAKNRLNELLTGRMVKLERHEVLELKSVRGRTLHSHLSTEFGAELRLDERASSAFIHGPPEAAESAERWLLENLKSCQKSVSKSIDLRGDQQPAGLMKALILQYGPNLDDLAIQCGVASAVTLDMRQHTLRFVGQPESYEKLQQMVQEIASKLPSRPSDGADTDDREECPVCLSQPEKDSYYVSEACGHVYCRECAENLVKNAICNNVIPMQCVAVNCSHNLALQDLRNLVGGNLRRVYDAAINKFTSKHTAEYGNCITPNCRMIYRREPKGTEGKQFLCSECQTVICTACAEAYHTGLTCEVYLRVRDNKEDLLFEQWLAKDPVNRSKCPKCSAGIEKNGGCQHMECTACHIHICWRCKATFSDSRSCYAHLTAVHGNYM